LIERAIGYCCDRNQVDICRRMALQSICYRDAVAGGAHVPSKVYVAASFHAPHLGPELIALRSGHSQQ
jgi:hypothetical protein